MYMAIKRTDKVILERTKFSFHSRLRWD